MFRMWEHDSPPLPNMLFLKHKHSKVLQICQPCRRTGAWTHVKKIWLAPSSQHVKFLQNQAMPGSHCLHCTPFSNNSFQHNLSDKNMPGSHFLNCKYPNTTTPFGNLSFPRMPGSQGISYLIPFISKNNKIPSSREIRFMMWKSYHCTENSKFSMKNWKYVKFPHPT